MRYTEQTSSYNERRYGKPWKAIISASLTKDFSFVDWNGRLGHEGEFIFDAEPGTLLAFGQKDLRKNKGGVDGYEICFPDGTIRSIVDSTVLALLKLSVTERVQACAQLKIEGSQRRIAEATRELTTETVNRAYWEEEITAAQAAIEHYRIFIPTTTADDSEALCCY